jgi:hypothetical protein
MSGLNQTFFGPLDKSACFYFYFLSLFFFVVLLFVLFKAIVYVFKNYKSIGFKNVAQGLLIIFNIFLAYFVNRLMYTMCNKSLM